MDGIKQHLSIERIIFLRNMATFTRPILPSEYINTFNVTARSARSSIERGMSVGFIDAVMISSRKQHTQTKPPRDVLHFRLSKLGRETMEVYAGMVIPKLTRSLVSGKVAKKTLVKVKSTPKPVQNPAKVKSAPPPSRKTIAPLPSFHQTVWVRP